MLRWNEWFCGICSVSAESGFTQATPSHLSHCKMFVSSVDLVLHLQCGFWHPEKATLIFFNNTTLVFSQQYQRGARPEHDLHSFKVKKQKIQHFFDIYKYLCPALTPPTNGKKTRHWLDTKISPFFIYQIASVGSCFRNTQFIHLFIEKKKRKELWLTHFIFPRIVRTHTNPGALSQKKKRKKSLSFAFVHIIKLQFYSHIFKFKFFAFWTSLFKKQKSSQKNPHLPSNASLKASKLLNIFILKGFHFVFENCRKFPGR